MCPGVMLENARKHARTAQNVQYASLARPGSSGKAWQPILNSPPRCLSSAQKKTLDGYPSDDTWDFLNLALLCVACLFSERKGSMCPGVMLENARKDARTAQNVQYASLLVMRSDATQCSSAKSRKTSRVLWQGLAVIQPGSSSIWWLHVYHTYLAKERKGCLQEMASDVIGHLDLL